MIKPFFYRFWWIVGLLPRTLFGSIAITKGQYFSEDRNEITSTNEEILEHIYNLVQDTIKKYYTDRYKITDDLELLRFASTCLKLEVFPLIKLDSDFDSKGKQFINYGGIEYHYIESNKSEKYLCHPFYIKIQNEIRKGKIFNNSKTHTYFLPPIVFEKLQKESLSAPFPTLPIWYRFNWKDLEIIDIKKLQLLTTYFMIIR